ncbi:MAG: SAM-dependent methyltransferase [Acidimicrobiales bacterium]
MHIVGAGPGDPMLLTRRAARLIGQADVVVLDRHSLDAVARLAPSSSERCYVGRAAEGPAWSTDRIVELIAARAAEGLTVVRLKGGDPFVCSRGGEEHLALRARGVPCGVVPGVSAFTAAPLAAGIVRGRAVTIVAGNEDPASPSLDIAGLVDPLGSLVVLTGRAQQGVLAAGLIAAGLPSATPVAVVHAATKPAQRVAMTSVAGLGACHLPPPATVVIGPVPAPGGRPVTASGRGHRAHP